MKPLCDPMNRNDAIDPDRPMIALTFDDGPHDVHTPKILNLLKNYGGHATFFIPGNKVKRRRHIILYLLEKYGGRATSLVHGNRVKRRRDVILNMVEAGHEILGHSWDHSNLTRLSENQIRQQITDTNAAIEAVTGVPQNMFRPPFGAINQKVRNVSAEIGFALIHWSVSSGDWETRNADTIYDDIMNNVRDRCIILAHDVHSFTVEAMERVIPSLIEQGYQLVTVSELMAFGPGVLEPGKVYYDGR